jgi:uncharacterized protein DUF6683
VLEKAFATDAVLREFDAFVAAHGFSSHNVGDAMAALLWSSWQIVQGVTLTEAQIRGIHQQVRAVFLANPQLRAMTVAGHQMVSESIAYLVMVEAAAMKNPDPAGLAQARQNAAANVPGAARQPGDARSRHPHPVQQGARSGPAAHPQRPGAVHLRLAPRTGILFQAGHPVERNRCDLRGDWRVTATRNPRGMSGPFGVTIAKWTQTIDRRKLTQKLPMRVAT